MRHTTPTLLALCCFASISLAGSIPDTIRINSWLTVGPFSTAPRENSIDYLTEHGGEGDIRPVAGMTHTSILVPGAQVMWRRTPTDSTGAVPMHYDSLSWDTLAQYYGTAALMTTSYAYAEFQSDVDGCALALADGVASFRLNGMVWPGDAYRQHFVRIPVPVHKGINRVLVKQSGFTGGSFVFTLLPASTPLTFIDRDFTLPDAVAGEMLDMPAGITMINACDKPSGPIRVHVGDTGVVVPFDTVFASLVPFSIIKVPVRLRSRGAVTPLPGDTLAVPITASARIGAITSTLKLRVRRPDATRRVTFISAMDGSAQYYGVAPPLKSDSTPGLLLSLHGASVEAQGQSEAYQRKDWAYVVAATNRRPYGFDWQDWGAQDALEVLADARARFSIDTNRIWLAGHSMGGHGTWSVGLHHPDLFAAIAPSAGWTSFPLYIPWTFQRSAVYADPEILAIRDRALRHDDLLNFADNASHLPAFVLHGSSDDNVPPIQARMFVDALRRAGDSVVFKEVPDMGHWWDNPKTPGTDCIDDASLMEFLKSRSRNSWPAHVHFHTVDLAQSNSAYWMRITAAEEPFADVVCDADLSESRVEVRTTNVHEFSIHLPPALRELRHNYSVLIDGVLVPSQAASGATVSFVKRGDHFAAGTDADNGLRKTPRLFGPMKQATFSPFALVYGTSGDSASTALLLHKARVLAQLWWRVGNGTVPIVSDADAAVLPPSTNLILLGSHDHNRVTARLELQLPIVVGRSGVRVGTSQIPGTGLAAQFIYPNPEHPSSFVLVMAGGGTDGESLAGAFGLFGSGTALPDYMVYDASVRMQGWGGVKAAGFFDRTWSVR